TLRTTSPISPAINAGVNNKLSTTDLAGNPRVAGGIVDLGAYESTATTTTPPPPSTTTLRNPDNPTGALAPGVNYNYYQGTWTQLPDFNTLTPVKPGNTTTFELSAASQADNFGFHFYGYVSVPADGEYTFGTKSNEGTKLYIGNQLVVSNDGLHNANLEQTGKIGLKAGLHFIAVDYFEATGVEFLQVLYEGPGVSKKIIPASALTRRDFSASARTALGTAKAAGASAALSAYPNPAHDRATLSYTVEQAGAVRLEVLDGLGRIVAVLVDGQQSAGPHEAVFAAPAHQGSALFNVRLITPTGTSFSRLALDK
uniref:PA14 domain-containing protein n=1 Tax=Hymenobacter terrenus TaxID=1629124 RepID=UPI0006191C26